MTRQEFEAGRKYSNDLEMLRKKITEAKEACELLEHNIIQGELTSIKGDRPVYRLKFRPEIEINDGHMKGNIKKCC